MTPAQLLKPVGTEEQTRQDPDVTVEPLTQIQKDFIQDLSKSAEADVLQARERKLVSIKRRSSRDGRRSSEMRN